LEQIVVDNHNIFVTCCASNLSTIWEVFYSSQKNLLLKLVRPCLVYCI